MKKSWLLNSVVILLLIFVAFGCRNQRHAVNTNPDIKKRGNIELTEKETETDQRVIPQPGTINPNQLDSLKRDLNKQKKQKINNSHE